MSQTLPISHLSRVYLCLLCSLLMICTSSVAAAEVPTTLQQAHASYYQTLNNADISTEQRTKQWLLLYQFLQQHPNFNLQGLTAYQLALSAAQKQNIVEYNKWLTVLESLNQGRSSLSLEFLIQKLQMILAYNQSDFETTINLAKQLLQQNIEPVVGEQAFSHTANLEVPERAVLAVINTLGRAHYRTGDYINAQISFLASLKHAEKYNNRVGMSRALNNLSVIAWGNEDLEKALEYLEQGLAISIEINDVKSIVAKWSNKGIYQTKLKQYDEAKLSLDNALAHPKIDQFPKLKINTLLAKAELNSMLKNYSESQKLATQALDLAKEIQDPYNINNSKLVLAEIEKALENYTKAEQLYLNVLTYYQNNQLKKEQSTALLYLSEIYRSLLQPDKALNYYTQYHQLYTELQQSEKNQAVVELQQKYEADVRKKQIALLKQDNELKAIEVAATKAQRNDILSYASAAFIIILLLISRYHSHVKAKRLKRYADEIKAREKDLLLLSNAFKSTTDAVWITDADFTIEVVNDAFLKMTLRKQPVGRKMGFAYVMGQDQQLTDTVMEEIKVKGRWQGEVFDQKASGEVYPIEIKIESITNEQGKVIHYLGAFRDISHRKKAEKQLKRMVTHDDLTGLPNRILFNQLIERSFMNVERHKTTPVVLFVDVDGFKKLNDSLGHETGDLFLRSIAKRLSQSLRSKDVVSRLGADEFGILVELSGDNVEAASVAKKLLDSFLEPFLFNQRAFKITVSIGVAVYPGDAVESEELIRKSDIAKNVAKQLGKNTFSFYEQHMNDEVIEMLDKELRIIDAIENQLFEFHYQPIVDVSKNIIVGAEALIRWREANGEMIFPDEFIPVAEKTGLIEQIDEIVVDKVFKQISIWNNSDISLNHVSINLSARIFSQADKLISLLEDKLSTYKINAYQVKIEITEGMLVENVNVVIDTMCRLKALGFILAIDDFGTGFSSLQYLKQFPIDILKIDRSFIMDMHDSHKNKSIVRTIVELAHNLDFSVIAEGVERVSHLDELTKLGCEEYQGYYFSRPVAVNQFETMYQEKKQLN
jgi:diguanylate cyclase (GGDEF)-like protein/PAS domain S-box-containing protein